MFKAQGCGVYFPYLLIFIFKFLITFKPTLAPLLLESWLLKTLQHYLVPPEDLGLFIIVER